MDAQLIPNELEKRQLLSVFHEMRKDGLFCDVSFLCHGVLYRAHRSLVSGWSRWLRALLIESPDEEVLSLDIFSSEEFGMVIDYMYGVPLTITIDTAENIIKIVRRLELPSLEKQCWRYLMTILDSLNMETLEALHELADRYDCPPLKLAAWRMMQESNPAFNFPTCKRLLNDISNRYNLTTKALEWGHGFTGPGDPYFKDRRKNLGKFNIKNANRNEDDDVYDDDDNSHHDNEEDPDDYDEFIRRRREMPSLFDAPDDDDDDDDEEEGGGRGFNLEKESRNVMILKSNAPAAEIVKAWSLRLKHIHNQCVGMSSSNNNNNRDMMEEDQDDYRVTKEDRNIRLIPRQSRGGGGGGMGRRRDEEEEKTDYPSNGNGRRGRKTMGRPDDDLSTIQDDPSKKGGQPHWTGLLGGMFTGGGGGGKGSKIDWKLELKRFYRAVHAPEKIAGIPTIMELWKGKEEEMITTLIEKYQDTIPTDMMNRLEELINILESQTESSFIKPNPVINDPIQKKNSKDNRSILNKKVKKR